MACSDGYGETNATLRFVVGLVTLGTTLVDRIGEPTLHNNGLHS